MIESGAAIVNPLDLSGRIFLVTGASSGIGRSIATLLSQLGARVVLCGRDRERLDETLNGMSGTGHSCTIADFAAVDSIPEWFTHVSEGTGKLDGLVHAAGIQITRPLRFLKMDEFQRMLAINVSAGIALAKAFRQRCRPEGSAIVFLSSVMGVTGQAAQVGYSATKGALVSMTKSLALELAREHIRVNAIAPGVVKTPMSQKLQDSLTDEQFGAIEQAHPLGVGTPLDVAYAAAFLLADTGRWITGTTLIVDGGYTAQ